MYEHVYGLLIISPMFNLVEDIYLFGGKSTNDDGTMTTSSEIHKLSIGEWDAVQ